MNKIIGLDIGKKRIGISISDIMGLIAHPVETIQREPESIAIEKIKKICKENNVKKIVAGLPKNMNNTIGFKGELAYQFKKMLELKINMEVILVDERLTTKEANNLLIKNDTSRKKRKKVVDSIAATIILQSYLDIEKNRKGD